MNSTNYRIRGRSGLVVSLLACGMLAVSLGMTGGSRAAFGQERQSAPPFDFQGRLLLSASDADMVSSAYIDGKLGPVDGADALSVIRLDRRGQGLSAVETPVSNSVTGPPASVVASPDGRYALVIETRGQRPSDPARTKFKDLLPGRAITVVSLADPDHPRVVQRLRTFDHPFSISLNAAGSLAAVSFSAEGAGKTIPIAFYRFRYGRLSAPRTPKIPGWTAGHSLIDVAFHPDKNILALLDVTKPSLSFVRVTESGGQIHLTRWGSSVAVEKGPFLVRFTPNGRYAVVNGTKTPHGSVLSVRLSASVGADGSPVHKIVSRAETGFMPEGLNISPNGHWVITTNLEHSYEPLGSPKQGFFSSLTLIRLDPETGQLSRVDDFPFDGVLPETAVFDNSSRFLAVTNYSHFDPRKSGGTIDFWRIATDVTNPGRVELVKLDYSIPVTRGPQSMVIVR